MHCETQLAINVATMRRHIASRCHQILQDIKQAFLTSHQQHKKDDIDTMAHDNKDANTKTNKIESYFFTVLSPTELEHARKLLMRFI